MSITPVQNTNFNAGAGVIAAGTFAGAQTAGNSNIVQVVYNNGATQSINSITDSEGNVYRPAGSRFNSVAAGIVEEIWWCSSIVGGAGGNVVSVEFTESLTGFFGVMSASEWSGGLNVVDRVITADGASSTTPTSAALQARYQNELVFVYVGTANPTTPGAGWTQLINDSTGDLIEYQTTTTGGSFTATATQTPAGSFAIIMVAFAVAPGTYRSNLGGTSVPFFQIGLSGPVWQSDNGVLEARDPTNAFFEIVRAAPGVVANDVAVIAQLPKVTRLVNNFVTTSNAQGATLLAFDIAPNEVWVVEIQLTAQCSNTGGVKYEIVAPAGCGIEGWLYSSLGAITTLSYQRITAINTPTATAVHTVANTPGPDRILFTITASSSSSGQVALAAASGTNGQTTTIFAFSSLIATKSSI